VPPTRRGIVIDASIAQAAGRHNHPVSSGCRAFLEEVRRVGHSLVLSDALMTEWKNHASSLARDWLRSMFARRKVNRLGLVPSLRIVVQILRAAPAQQQTVLKDVHLVGAALEADCPVASLDDQARRLLQRSITHDGKSEGCGMGEPNQG